jgi:hypothetical protein
MKNSKSFSLILTSLLLIVVTTSCKKDKVDTTPSNSPVSYKKVECLSDDSILIVDQCVVVKEPFSDFLNITMKLKYTGEKYAVFPKLVIRGKDKNGKILFEDLSYLSNMSSVCRYYSNTYGSSFVSKTFPYAHSYGMIDMTKFVGDAAFTYDDIYSIDITKIEVDEEPELEQEIDTSLVFDPIKNDGNKLISYFTNKSQMEVNFSNNYEITFLYDENDQLLNSDIVDLFPKLIFKPNEKGYFTRENTYYNHKVSRMDISLNYELDTIKAARILKNKCQYDDYVLSRKIMKQDYELLKSRRK